MLLLSAAVRQRSAAVYLYIAIISTQRNYYSKAAVSSQILYSTLFTPASPHHRNSLLLIPPPYILHPEILLISRSFLILRGNNPTKCHTITGFGRG